MCLALASNALCCAGSTVCDCCCLCCTSICGATLKQLVKLTYIIIQALSMVFTIVFLYYASDALQPFSDFIHCPNESSGQLVCLGVSSVYRMSLALAVVHFVLLLICLTRSEFAKGVNEGFWLLKVLAIFGLWIAFLFVSNSFFEGYSNFAKFIGGLFLLLQIIIIIDLCYMWGELWIIKYDEGEKSYGIYLISATVIFYVGIITLHVYMFIWFAPQSDCGLTVFLIIFSLVLIILISVLSISGIAVNGSLLTSGSFSLYLTYVLWSALASNPNQECNELYASKNVMITGIVVGFFLILMTLFYMVFNTSQASSKRIKLGNNHDANTGILLDNGKQNVEENGLQNDNNDLSPYKSNLYIAFHIIMTICAIYISMMLTNWGSPNINDTKLNKFLPSETSFWIQIIASWIGYVFFIWTVVAQKVFPDREFGGHQV